MRPKHPAAQGPNANNTHRDDGIIERLGVHRVCCGQAENDRYEADPSDADEGDWAGGNAEVERAFFEDETAVVDETDEDWDTVGDVQPDGGDGGCGCEGD
jgi:hypothetical protein